MERNKALDQLLGELQAFLVMLDVENLSSKAIIQKGLLSDLLHTYTSKDQQLDVLYMGEEETHIPTPQNGLPDHPQTLYMESGLESPESYYESYEPTPNEDCGGMSSSYESYDEEEVTKEKSVPHQWPSTEASIALMKDAQICAFLWRKKWLGKWVKQLCVIKEQHLLCYKCSKEQTPLLDVSLAGCSVVMQLKKKEYNLRIAPVGAEAIVLGLHSKEQAKQWLKVIEESRRMSVDMSTVPSATDTKGDLSMALTDCHAQSTDNKEPRRKYVSALKFSDLKNLGKKKMPPSESPDKCLDTSGYLNVLVNSQWRVRWCLIKDGQLFFYQDKGKTKESQHPMPLSGCMVLPDPSSDHPYSLCLWQDGKQLTTLEAKSSTEMGHWLGLFLSQSGSRNDPEELLHCYVNSEQISSIARAARTSMDMMQKRGSQINTYIDSLPTAVIDPDDIYEEVPIYESEESLSEVDSVTQDSVNRVYIDLSPVRSFLHTSQAHQDSSLSQEPPGPFQPKQWEPPNQGRGKRQDRPRMASHEPAQTERSTQSDPQKEEDEQPVSSPAVDRSKSQSLSLSQFYSHSNERPFPLQEAQRRTGLNSQFSSSGVGTSTESLEQINSLTAGPMQHRRLEVSLTETEETCQEKERRHVDLKLQPNVKESLKKMEARPSTLETDMQMQIMSAATPASSSDTSPISSFTSQKHRPVSVIPRSRANVLQKAKEWEKKGTTWRPSGKANSSFYTPVKHCSPLSLNLPHT
ncbi:actin filament-associated protein 1-like 2 isoform X2 [Megalops cyprinoides]|uniref:actin filament-associated protein 1-like 2 isoform X2 n=1 Tax=Megalops cyprinoides TaxID=118141 RepID=UPI001864E9FD|nr:actin filament-associated protein 1-like 2 isoform X2 [Megalops cyprinoides]